MTEFQMKILHEINSWPNGMATVRDLLPFVAHRKLTARNAGAYATNIDRAAIKMPKMITRLPPEGQCNSPTLCLTDAALKVIK